MTANHVKFSLKNEQPFRLVAARNGMHQFGGRSPHPVAMPAGATEPLQLVFLLDLTDQQLPIGAEPSVATLPLYYPYKYGGGGPAIQYAVRSDSQIEVLYLSDIRPDDSELQYLQVAELPTARFEIRPLTYEQARILAFRREDGFFQPNASDRKLLDELDVNNLITLGGRRNHIVNAGDIICRNPDCEWFERRTHFELLAAVPPVKVNDQDEFWHEFRGGNVDFCFGFCYFCGTIIAFNVCT